MHPAFALTRKLLVETRVEFDTFLTADQEMLVPMEKNDNPRAAWVRTVARASGIEGVHTGMERALKVVLQVTDGGVFSEGTGFSRSVAGAGERSHRRPQKRDIG